jgi:hypothetical protein
MEHDVDMPAIRAWFSALPKLDKVSALHIFPVMYWRTRFAW